MGIFSDHKTIIAVFDTDQQLEQVTEQLNNRGLIPKDDDSFTIIDHDADETASPEGPAFAVPAAVPAANTGGSGLVGLPVMLDPHHTDDNGESTQRWLTGKGLDDSEASYYAMQVRRGGKVLILEADKDHVSEIVNLIEPLSERVTVA
jgi:hypothetical protein